VTELRCLTDNELALIQPLFASVFGSSISLALLQWKYAQGRGSAWTLWQEDILLMHCGLCLREVLLQGKRVLAAQLVDLMAAPKPAGLSRQTSPFAVLMRHVLAQLPSPANPDGVAFGFPSARAMRLGEHAGVYCAVDQWMALEFGPQQMRLGPRASEIVTWGARETLAANALWSRMRADLAAYVVGVRDVDYLHHRYLMHPHKLYRVLLVESRWRRQAMGLLVIGPGTGGDELLDVICAWDDMAEVLLAARRWLHETGGQRLTLNLTSHFGQQLAALSDGCTATQFRIMANPQTPAATLKKLDRRWWLTGGDTDYR